VIVYNYTTHRNLRWLYRRTLRTARVIDTSRVKFRAADIERLIDAVWWRQNFSRDQKHSRIAEQHCAFRHFSGLRLRLHEWYLSQSAAACFPFPKLRLFVLESFLLSLFIPLHSSFSIPEITSQSGRGSVIKVYTHAVAQLFYLVFRNILGENLCSVLRAALRLCVKISLMQKLLSHR